MATPAMALTADKRRTTVTLPSLLLLEAEELAAKWNISVSTVIAQATEIGMGSIRRKEQSKQAYLQLRSALTDLTEDEQLLVDGIHMSPLSAAE